MEVCKLRGMLSRFSLYSCTSLTVGLIDCILLSDVLTHYSRLEPRGVLTPGRAL